jgi:small subunit ribosomal protein S24e
MNINLNKKRNELLHRTNIIATITNMTTPTRKEILKKVAAILGCDEKLVVIDKINQNYGEHKSLAYIKVYDKYKYLKDIELDYKIKRTGEKEDLKKEDLKKEDLKKAEGPKKEEDPNKKDNK